MCSEDMVFERSLQRTLGNWAGNYNPRPGTRARLIAAARREKLASQADVLVEGRHAYRPIDLDANSGVMGALPLFNQYFWLIFSAPARIRL